MKCIILSAGQGRRMMPLTKSTPKCLLEIDTDTTVLGLQLDTLREAANKLDKELQVVIVTGYMSGNVEEFVVDYSRHHRLSGSAIKTIYNPFYKVADNYMSLWFARNEFADIDTYLVINGDNVFDPGVIIGLMGDKNPFVSVISVRKKYGWDDMKVLINDGQITTISKSLPKGNGENAGIIKLKGESARLLRLSLIKGGYEDRHLKDYWLEAIMDVISCGCDLIPYEVDRNEWSEIDIHSDLEDIKNNLSDVRQKWKMMNKEI